MGIKLFGLGIRRKDMSREDFHDYWRHPHGTWGRKMTTLRGYVQSHQIDTELLGPEQSHRELVAEMWLDNLEDLARFREEPILVKYLLEDEPRFTEGERIFFPAREEVLTSAPSAKGRLNPGDDMYVLETRPFSIKLLHFVGADTTAEWATPQDEARGLRLGAVRHVRCHPVQMGSSPPRFRGVHELWWPTVRAFRAGVNAAPEDFKALIATAGLSSVTLLAQAERLL
jgi:EthD domain